MRVVVVVLLLVALGAWVRVAVWDASRPLRFESDIRNGLHWGTQALREGHERAGAGVGAGVGVPWDEPGALTAGEFLGGYVGTYDRAVRQADGGRVELDYAPLRLLVMATWARSVREADPSVEGRGDYRDELATPLLWMNGLVGLLAAGLAGGVVWTWTGRRWAAVLAGALLWLSPAYLVNAHAWPQWDGWLLPVWLGAVWAAATGRTWGWGLAGAVVGAGCMLKGQVLLAAPVLPVWAVVTGQWRGLLALGGGLLGGVYAVTWPWVGDGGPLVLGAVTPLLARRVPIARRAGWAVLLLGPLALAGGYVGGGDFGWLRVGFPTAKYPRLHVGPAGNLPAVLAGMGFTHAGAAGWLKLAGTAGVVLAGVAAGRRWRAGDPRWLACVALPLLVAYAVLPQMHERYGVWAAALLALPAAVDGRAAVAYLMMNAAACVAMLQVMLEVNGHDGPWLAAARAVHPGVGWAVATLAGLALADALLGSPPCRPPRCTSPTS